MKKELKSQLKNLIAEIEEHLPPSCKGLTKQVHRIFGEVRHEQTEMKKQLKATDQERQKMARYISDQKKNFEAFKEASFESYTAASHVNARVVEYMKLLDSKGGEQVRTLDVIYNNQIVAGVLLLPGVKVRPRMHRMTKIGHDPLQYVLSLTDEPDISK